MAQGNSLQQGLTQGALAGAGAGVTQGFEAAGGLENAATTTGEVANAAGTKAAADLTAEGFVNTSPLTGGVSGSAAPDIVSMPAANAAAAANGISGGAGTSYAIPDAANIATVPNPAPSALDVGMNTYPNSVPSPLDAGMNTYNPVSQASPQLSPPASLEPSPIDTFQSPGIERQYVGPTVDKQAYSEILKRQAIDEAGGAVPRMSDKLLGSERLANIVTGASNPDTLKNVLLSKNGLMLGLGAIGASGMLDPKNPNKAPDNIMSSSYRPISAYDRKVSFAPAGYDRRLGEYNYFPGDRYARYAMGGQVDQPAVPLDLSQNYPGSNIMKSSYASLPSTDSQEVVDGYGPKINPFTGAEKMAAGGIATFDQGGDISRIREIRRSYSSRAQAEKDAMRGGDVAKRLGLASGDDPALNYAFGPRQHLDGKGDGMSDSIPATIEGRQPALLSKDEFVVPADVVSHLGNGSSEAGADKLYKMLDKVRQARTGTKKQGKQIVPEKYLPA
jgi:hypothetical protein